MDDINEADDDALSLDSLEDKPEASKDSASDVNDDAGETKDKPSSVDPQTDPVNTGAPVDRASFDNKPDAPDIDLDAALAAVPNIFPNQDEEPSAAVLPPDNTADILAAIDEGAKVLADAELDVPRLQLGSIAAENQAPPQPDGDATSEHELAQEQTAKPVGLPAPDGALPMPVQVADVDDDGDGAAGDADVADEEDDVVDPDDPLVARLQAAMMAQLQDAATRLDENLRERNEEVKRLNKKRETIGVDLYGLQQQLARMQMQLEKTHDRFNMFNRLRAKAEEDRELLLADLSSKSAARDTALQHAELIAREFNNVSTTLRQVAEYNESIKSEIKVTRRAAYAEEAEMTKQEKEKKAQDYQIAAMNEQIAGLQARVQTLTEQVATQKSQTGGARETIQLALDEMAQIRADKNEYISKWKSALIALSRRNKALEGCDRERQRLQAELVRLDSEYAGFVKDVRREQETNEKLTEVLTKVITECKFIEAQIARIQTARTKASSEYDVFKDQLAKTDEQLQEVQGQRRLLELEIQRIEKCISASDAARTAIENEILEKMSNQTTTEQGTQNTLKAIMKLRKTIEATEKKIGAAQNEIARVKVDILNTTAHNKDLKKTLAAFEKELKEKDLLIDKYETENALRNDMIQKKQIAIDALNRKYEQLTKNVVEDTSSASLEGKIDGLNRELQAVRNSSTDLQRKWIGTQTELLEVEAISSAEINKVAELAARHTVLGQKSKRLQRLRASVTDEIKELRKTMTSIHLEITKLNGLLVEFKTRQETLGSENRTSEITFKERGVQIEQERAGGEKKIEALQAARDSLLEEVSEISAQILIWERKINLEKETQQAIDPEVGQAEVEEMRREVHRMELRLNALKRAQEELMEDSLRTIEKRNDIQIRHLNSKRTDMTQASLRKKIASLRNEIKLKSGESRQVEQSIRRQEDNTRILIEMCEKLQTQFNELDDEKATLEQKLHLAEFQKALTSEMLAIYLETKARLSSSAPVRSTGASHVSFTQQVERLEALKTRLRELKVEFVDAEPYLDTLLRFATAT
ncbi:Coiled-coil domain-containing protein 40 [Plasmodiophora brassicae]